MSEKRFGLKELEGEYDKIAISHTPPKVDKNYWGEKPNTFAFRLGDKFFLAAENPEDGYRSSLDYIIEIDELPDSSEIINRPVKAYFINKRDNDSYYECCEILKIEDIETGHIWLEVGTDNTDDYYPWFVAKWWPMENNS